MSGMVYLFLADGFEEIEALTPVDLLRRAKIDVKTVGIGQKTVMGAHNIPVVADMACDEVQADFEGVILPGGLPGTTNLEADPTVQKALCIAAENGKMIAAICAAPSIPGHCGLLQGKQAICYPGFEQELIGAEIAKVSVVRDGNMITAKAAGAATEFALEIIRYLRDDAAAQQIACAIHYKGGQAQ